MPSYIRALAVRATALLGVLCLSAGCGSSFPVESKAGVLQFPQTENAIFNAVAADPAGGIAAGGYIFTPENGARMFIMRMLADGRPDARFGNGGAVEFRQPGRPNSVVYDLTIDPASRILACGLSYTTTPDRTLVESTATLARFLPDGTVDSAFGVNGIVEIPAAIAGAQGICRQVRARGSGYVMGVQNMAPSYAVPFPEGLRDVGAAALAPAMGVATLAAVTDSGQLDTSFGTVGIARISPGGPSAPRFALDAEDRIVLKYHDHVYSEFNNDLVVERRLADGSLDPAFADAGRLVLERGEDLGDGNGRAALASDLIVGGDQAIYLAGVLWTVSGADATEQRVLWRVGPAGTPDDAVKRNSLASLARYAGVPYGLTEVPGIGLVTLLVDGGGPPLLLHLAAGGSEASSPRALSLQPTAHAFGGGARVVVAGLLSSGDATVPALQIVPLK